MLFSPFVTQETDLGAFMHKNCLGVLDTNIYGNECERLKLEKQQTVFADLQRSQLMNKECFFLSRNTGICEHLTGW